MTLKPAARKPAACKLAALKPPLCKPKAKIKNKVKAEIKGARIYYYNKLTQTDILDIAAALTRGKIAVLPTDTVYGLTVCALRKDALKKLNSAKENPSAKPPQLLANLEQAYVFAQGAAADGLFARAAESFWPGACTIVAKASARGKALLKALPPLLKQTVGLRVPKDKFILNILELIKSPLFASSANLHGKEVCVTEGEILKTFQNRADIIVLNGRLKGRPSTVIDVSAGALHILRAGVLTEREIKKRLS